MQVEISEHITLLILSIVAGAVAGAAYDAVRLLRTFFGLGIDYRASCALSNVSLPIIGAPKERVRGRGKIAAADAAVFVFDIAYMLILTLAAVIFLYRTSNGTPRLFSLVGMAAGFYAYMATVGKLTAAVSSYILFAVEVAVRYAVWLTVTPIKAAARGLYRVAALIYKKTIKRFTEKIRRRRSEKRTRRYMDVELPKMISGMAAAISDDKAVGEKENA